MNETTTNKRREIIKTVAIVFLAFLLILTLFSNTIRNRSLPEVAVQYTTSDSVSNGIRVSGVVSASKSYSIIPDETRTVKAVAVRNGDEVLAGDVLFELEDEESEELTAARKQLESLQLDLERALLGVTTPDTEAETRALSAAQAAHNSAVAELNAYKAALPASEEQKTADAALRVLESMKKWMGEQYNTALPGLNNELAIAYYAAFIGVGADELFAAAPPADHSYANLKDTYKTALAAILADAADPSFDEAARTALTGWAAGNAALSDEHFAQLVTVLGAADKADLFNAAVFDARAFAALKPEYAAYKDRIRAAAEADVNSANWTLTSMLAQYQAAVDTTARTLADAHKALADKQTANTVSGKLTEMELQAKRDAIAEQQKLVSDLLANATEAVITARQAGVVTELAVVAGQKLDAGATACVIQLTDTGYTAEISLTGAQAARVQVGSTATVSGYYWGETPRAVVSGIRSDTNIRGNRIVTLTLTGSVEAGSNYNFILGETNSMYDTVVPKSAVREDNTGPFVLVITEKSSPLGTRYYVTRTDVSVLASDDTRCAVSGEFTGWDYVVTSSSAPIEAGDQVRLANS